MRYVGIEFTIRNVSNEYKGWLKIPNDFPPNWHIGFVKYLKDNKNVTKIDIYPYKIDTNPEDMGDGPRGWINMEDDFNLALRSNKYYPPTKENQHIRRLWSTFDPVNLTYAPKGRSKLGYNPQ